MRVGITSPALRSLTIGTIPLKCWSTSFTLPLTGAQVTLASTLGANSYLHVGIATATLQMSPGYGAELTGTVNIGQVLGNSFATGVLQAHLDNQDGLTLAKACFELASSIGSVQVLTISVGLLPVKSAQLCYQPGLQELKGRIVLGLPQGGLGPQLVGALAVHVSGVGLFPLPGLPGADHLDFIQLGLQTFNKPIAPYVFVQRLGGELDLYPHLGFAGHVGLSVLPTVNFIGQQFALVSVDGAAKIMFGGDNGFDDIFFPNAPGSYVANTSGSSNTVNVDGEVKLLSPGSIGLSLASGHVTYKTHGLTSFSGTIVPGTVPGLGIGGSLSGLVEAPHWTAHGEGEWTEFGAGIQGLSTASDKGFAGCGGPTPGTLLLLGPGATLGLLGVEVGFKIEHGLSFFLGCDFGDLNPVAHASAAAADRSIVVRRGTRREEIAVRGATAPPSVV